MKKFAPIVVRIGISLVVIWFGTQQLLHASQWTSLLPDWTTKLPISEVTLIHLNGWFEVIFGLLLLVGFYTRIIGLLIALHLLEITYTVGYGAIGVRDFGLTLAAFSVFFGGFDAWCLDALFDKKLEVANGNLAP